MIRKALTRKERKTALEFTSAEMHRWADKVAKIDPDDKTAMLDAEEASEIMAGSFSIMREDVIAEEEERDRLARKAGIQ